MGNSNKVKKIKKTTKKDEKEALISEGGPVQHIAPVQRTSKDNACIPVSWNTHILNKICKAGAGVHRTAIDLINARI